MGPLARFALPALLAVAALPVAAPAQAAAPPVYELGGRGGALPGASGATAKVAPRPSATDLRGPHAGPSSERVADATAAGARTNGKIVAVDPSKGPYSCSGTALNTPSRSIVLTAGHCVLQRRIAGRRIAFVPAYDHGKRPFGTYRVEAVYVMPQWRRGENPAFDVAALRVKSSRLGRLVDVVGGRGYLTGRSRLSRFQIFGYPAAALRGEELRSCRARGLGTDPLTDRFTGPPTMPASCDMAAGASGGAWIVSGQYVNGVTSYGYAARPTRLFSPYFGPEIGSFLRRLP